MESLLHYVWKHKFFPPHPLTTTDGLPINVIDPGLHNTHQGPDFFNAKIRIDGQLWVGNVEIHDHATDWFRHHHHTDEAYNNVILHVVGKDDGKAQTQSGNLIPQMVLAIPEKIQSNYQALLAEENYPPCYRIIPKLPPITAHGWLSSLMVERLENKTERIFRWLERTNGDWERVFFITLARNFGFNTNADAFEQWAWSIPPMVINKHRDHPTQVEAIFLGQAGLLSDRMVPEDCRDEYYLTLQKEYHYLAHKFTLEPVNPKIWKFLRMRPQNFPHMRLSQLSMLFQKQEMNFSHLLEIARREDCHRLFATTTSQYWESHYSFGKESEKRTKTLQKGTLDLLMINSVAPLLFAYGRQHLEEERCERAVDFLEHIPAEQNYITRSWNHSGIHANHAADSQALIHLRNHYCLTKNCLHCRFGIVYISQRE